MQEETVAEAIRRRPGMYIGDVHDGSGLVHMVWELVSNSLDQHFAGRCNRIDVSLESDGSLVVEDDGPGIPITDLDGRPFAEVALTEFHATPTFDGHAPHEHVGAGRPGVGLFPVNVLSSLLLLDVFSDGSHHAQRFEKGRAVTALEVVGPCTRTGTRITLRPDPGIFSDTWFNAGAITPRLRELSCLLPGLTLAFHDRREHVYRERAGLVALLGPRRWRDPIGGTFTLEERVGEIRVEVAAEWLANSQGKVDSFANVERTTGGGKHVDGLIDGFDAALSDAVADWKSVPKRNRVQAINEGLNAVVCVRLLDPSYGGPIKARLETAEAKQAVSTAVRAPFIAFLERHPALLDHLVRRAAR